MMSGDKQTKEDFELLSKNQARQIIRRFINNNDLVEKLVAGIDEDKITGHILKDILSTNFSFDKIKTALEKRIQELKSKDLSTVMTIFLESDDSIKKSDADKEKEKKKFIGLPSNDIEQLLKEFDSADAIEKMKEHDIDHKQFWELSKDDLKSMLDIKIYGRLEKLMKRLTKIKKEHNKKMEKEYKKLEC